MSGRRGPRRAWSGLGAALLSVAAAAAAVVAVVTASSAHARPPSTDPRQWMVELVDEPAALAWARAQPAGGRAALAASIATLQAIEREQARLEAAITAPEVGARVQYRTQRVFNGIAIWVDPSRVDAIRALPGVKSVRPLVLHERDNSTSVPFLGVPQQVWQALGNAGEGVKLGIIDSGVDYIHANFGGTGAQADYQANDRTVAPDSYFPNSRVVGGRDFAGDDYGTGSTPARPDNDPMDCGGHGSHVAGSAAGSGVTSDGRTFTGPYDASVPFSSLRIGPGVAPKASIYSLRVFGCTGSTGLATQAIEWAVDPNKDGDLSDRMDVINMSLGSSFGTAEDSTAVASDNAARAGVVVVCSAGNSGDTFFITGSPGTSSFALSVAASVDSGLPAPSLRIVSPASVAGAVSAGTAAFGTAPPSAGTSGTLVYAAPADACATLTNGPAVSGKIALIDRGACNFIDKVRRAQQAGAIGVVVANNVDGTLNMGGTDAAVTIPSVLVSLADGNRLKAVLAEGVSVTLHHGGDLLASFSSRGPRRESRPAGPKPDIAAPGSSITSTQSGIQYTSGAPQIVPGSTSLVLSGTSMAAPHMAGVMALLKKRRPTWTPPELKAAVMNTARFDVSRFAPAGTAPIYGASRVGAGRVDAAGALATEVIAFSSDAPEVVSLWAFVEGKAATTVTRKVRVLNKGASPVTLTPSFVAASSVPGVRVEVPTAPITVPAGDSTVFDVGISITDPSAVTHAPDPTMSRTQASFAPLSSRFWMTELTGSVILSGSPTGSLRVPLQVVVRPQSDVTAPSSGLPSAAGAFSIPLTGTGLKGSTAPPVGIVSTVSAFELHLESASAVGSSADLAWVGAASSVPSTGFGADATVWFGLATHSEWLTPAEASFEIQVDRNADSVVDAKVTTMQSGEVPDPANPSSSGGTTDVYIAFASGNAPDFDEGTYRYVNLDPAQRDTNLFVSNLVVVPASVATLGLSAGSARFRYRVVARDENGRTVETTPWLTFDAEKPGYSALAADGTPFHDDLGGSSIPARYDPAAAQATGALGVLLLHHHNPLALRAQTVTGRNSAPTVSVVEPASGGTYDAAAPVRLRASGSDPDSGDVLSYTWDLGDGRTAAGADTTVSWGRAGTFVARVTARDAAGATASAQVSIAIREPQPPSGVSSMLPVVLDVRGVGGAHYTTEVTLVSRSAASARALLRYTASRGEGSGWAGVDLSPGETRILPDVIAFLRSQGLAIPADGSGQVGTLLVTLPGSSAASELFVGGRTSTPGEGGTFGLFYGGAGGTDAALVVPGLQQGDSVRSNLALVNTGSDPITLRVALRGPLGEDLGSLADTTLPARGWTQLDRPLEGKAASGRATVTRVSGSAPFTAYGVLNDAFTSDGSFIPPLRADETGSADRLIPVVVDVRGLGSSRYTTELTLANLGTSALALTLSYRATEAFGGGSGDVPLTLLAGEQRVIADAMAFLRAGGLAIPSGTNVAGSLLVKAPSGTAAGALAAGGRTFTPAASGSGTFGVFYPGLTLAESATASAWVHGLQQNDAMRSNLALANHGDAGDAITLRISFVDASGHALGSPEQRTLAPGEWLQLNQPLGAFGAPAGSARIERVSGSSRFVAYGVLNDAVTSDGSYLPMSR